MMIRRCTGAVIYDYKSRIFLMTKDKWEGWIVPGGGIRGRETPLTCIRREIREEMGIEIADVLLVGESEPATPEFHKRDVQFHFYDFYARALSTAVVPNHEIRSYGWFNKRDAMSLPMPKPIHDLLTKFYGSDQYKALK
jgi:8-oxo-dGTP pyrophosphatase MutT (NUDIX family)